MANAAGSQHEIALIKESTYNTTPASPVFKKLRITGTSGGLEKTVNTSAEIRADRMITDLRHGNKKAPLEIPFELSYSTFDDLLESALFGTWTTNVLKAGTTKSSYTLERKFADIVQYFRYTGCVVDKLKLSIKPDKIVTGSFSILGGGFSSGTAILGGATYTAAPTNTPYDSFTGSINEGGSAIAIVTGIDLELDNGLEALYAIMNASPVDLVAGRSNVKGSVDVFFQDVAMYNKFVNETASSLDFTLGVTSKTYQFKCGTIKYTGGKVDVSGDGPITLSMPFQALYDTSTQTNLQITRVP